MPHGKKTGINTIMLVGNVGQETGKLVDMLSRHYNIVFFGSGDEAAAALSNQAPETRERVRLIICEQSLRGMAGSDFLQRSVSLVPRARRILLIDYPQLDMDALLRAQLYRFITKPYAVESLLSTARAALTEIEKEHRPLLCDPEILGRAPRFLEVLDLVRRFSDSHAPVLVRGETGTGKELIARALHRNGPRSGQPYVVVNCSALPETLFETEMFGCRKGAFTGAHENRKGRAAQADGGTLFIDELAEIPLQMQAKLLRFLQFGEYQPVGGERIERADVRIVTATNGDLEKKIEDGTFRKDLYYRLKVMEITLPPLRERRPDIPLLARAFVKKYWTRTEEPILTGHTLKVLGDYDFPGNVRELENVVRRACVLARTEEIDLDVLPPTLLKAVLEKGSIKSAEGDPGHMVFSRLDKEELKRVRSEAAVRAGYRVEEEFLRRLMARFDSVTKAAEYAGMQRTHLHSMLAKHGLSRR